MFSDSRPARGQILSKVSTTSHKVSLSRFEPSPDPRIHAVLDAPIRHIGSALDTFEPFGRCKVRFAHEAVIRGF